MGACPPPAPEDHISGLAPGACQVGWTGAGVRIAIRNLRLAMTLMSHRRPLEAEAAVSGLGNREGEGQGQSQWATLRMYRILGMARMPMAASTEDADLGQELGF